MTFVVPFAMALLIGGVGITRQAWRDEHATWWAATIPWPDFTALLSHVDAVLAPYYLFMRAWIPLFGDSVVAMRLPSLLAMSTAAGLTAVLGARLFTPWIGLTAGILLAVVPNISRYAEEARPYALALAFAVASLLAALTHRWLLVALFTALTGLSHLVALTVLIAHLIYLLYPLLSSPSAISPSAISPSAISPSATGTWWERSRIKGVLSKSGNRNVAPATPLLPTTTSHSVSGETTAQGVAGAERAESVGVLWRWSLAATAALLVVAPVAWMGIGQSGQVGWINATWKNLVTLPMALTRSGAVAGILCGLAVLGILGTPSVPHRRQNRSRSQVRQEAAAHAGGAATLGVFGDLATMSPQDLQECRILGAFGRPGDRWAARSSEVADLAGWRGMATVVGWAMGPPVAVFVVAPEFFYYRYLLFTLPAWVLLAAVGAARAVRGLGRSRRIVVAGALCALMLVLGARDQVGVRKSPLAGDQDYRGAASYLGAMMQAGDRVLFDGHPDQRERFGFAYEWRSRTAPAGCDDCLGATDRVWLVSNREPVVPPGFSVLEARHFAGIELRLISRSHG